MIFLKTLKNEIPLEQYFSCPTMGPVIHNNIYSEFFNEVKDNLEIDQIKIQNRPKIIESKGITHYDERKIQQILSAKKKLDEHLKSLKNIIKIADNEFLITHSLLEIQIYPNDYRRNFAALQNRYIWKGVHIKEDDINDVAIMRNPITITEEKEFCPATYLNAYRLLLSHVEDEEKKVRSLEGDHVDIKRLTTTLLTSDGTLRVKPLHKGNLLDVIKKGINLETLIKIVSDAAIGLGTIHQAGYVHNNLMLNNILVYKNADEISANVTNFLNMSTYGSPSYDIFRLGSIFKKIMENPNYFFYKKNDDLRRKNIEAPLICRMIQLAEDMTSDHPPSARQVFRRLESTFLL